MHISNVIVDDPRHWNAVGYASRISADTASYAAYVRVVDWLRECREKHTKCRASYEPALPSRVLDLVKLDQTSTIKLLETGGMRGEYVCLSHCWGNAQLITTERKTLELRKAGIPWDALSKTFQDAIVFTRCLQVRYLWIDSLCIIQDDQDDWRREAANMASIYENAWLTIAATKSSGGAGGCFSVASSKHQAKLLTFLNIMTTNGIARAAPYITQQGDIINLHCRNMT
jgi:hypothetical protein